MNREGMDAVMNDTAGVIDRDNAHHELANRFQVVGDDYHGRRRSNTVSQAEFDSVAHLYSDMRLGRGDLTVDAAQSQVVSSGDPTAPNKTEVAALPADEQDAWRTHAMSDIATILQTRTGREELGLLAANANHRHTTIGPHMMMAGLPDGTNATSVAANLRRPDCRPMAVRARAPTSRFASIKVTGCMAVMLPRDGTRGWTRCGAT